MFDTQVISKVYISMQSKCNRPCKAIQRESVYLRYYIFTKSEVRGRETFHLKIVLFIHKSMWAFFPTSVARLYCYMYTFDVWIETDEGEFKICFNWRSIILVLCTSQCESGTPPPTLGWPKNSDGEKLSVRIPIQPLAFTIKISSQMIYVYHL